MTVYEFIRIEKINGNPVETVRGPDSEAQDRSLDGNSALVLFGGCSPGPGKSSGPVQKSPARGGHRGGL